MRPVVEDSLTSATARPDASRENSAEPSDGGDAQGRFEPWNFVILAAYQVLMRTGWIFKTESIIMPAVLDSIGGASWLRGCLPLLNRFGQSIPPLVAARQVKIAQRKKWPLALATLFMSLTFLALSATWFLVQPDQPTTGAWVRGALPLGFLVLYTLFFMATGVMQLSFSTIQGKLIQTTHRGRLLLAASVVGALSAIGCASWLLPRWVRPESAQFGWVFLFAGLCFSASAFVVLLAREPPDHFQQKRRSLLRLFSGAWQTLGGDANFRRLAICGATFGTSLMLFPHYQALGRGDRLQFTMTDLIGWVIVQNAGTALFSLVAGPVADWRGNRLVLRCTLLAICGAPLAAIVISHLGPAASWTFPIVFVLVGLTPVTFKVFNNYTLEVAKPADHPRYLSTLSLCMSAPIFFSPAVGWLVDVAGFDAVFIGITVLVLIGWCLTFTLQEPRHGLVSEEPVG